MVYETAPNPKVKIPMTDAKPLKSANKHAIKQGALPLLAASDIVPDGAPNIPRLIGYVRVSTHEQNTDLQYDALRKLGCDPIFEDKITGVALTRTGLDRALNSIRAGDKFPM
jgi:Resolvase, N terminal domain